MEILLFVVLPMLLALWVTRRVDRLLASRRVFGRWWRIVSIWCVVSSLALFAACSYYAGQDAETSLTAMHKDGGFKAIAFFFWNALLILSANGVAAGIAWIRGRPTT
ncbi:hypothetical protein [Pseudoxanthomonas sp. PXM01]|uniref:hypothetical protein n=1 Tax=Pseudoxanthomonas sp. PXM01 TaxID=2769295 RepID=UPI0017875EC3|nr:hypothetical protein [Pseudoxanthomonas sp. PXM01]MBD9469201.1 hypothetical protein [Pseudoxanthomonas sp. PXM01]